MGVLIQTVDDPAQNTPMYSTNATGGKTWGGRHVSELTASDLVAVLDFCRHEATRVGWNDANNGQTDVHRSNPFDPELLGGYPYREWTACYLQGIREHALATVAGVADSNLSKTETALMRGSLARRPVSKQDFFNTIHRKLSLIWRLVQRPHRVQSV
ncbi:hypothetical protein FVF58_43655 [Paraburkholderia panacisoli]|uniref:Uncharacterized protein n=1 Tax=Paraburkholderia panacisoli TaxID=2603818 RepID=A0A5B0G7E4_9BURK|nr:hypothetical protein [Paraburkholderia panacisoli]KAA0998625.1 hypothetical protein FVF58_43655 [Paraburkholderia panacisoli]